MADKHVLVSGAFSNAQTATQGSCSYDVHIGFKRIIGCAGVSNPGSYGTNAAPGNFPSNTGGQQYAQPGVTNPGTYGTNATPGNIPSNTGGQQYSHPGSTY